MPEAAAAGGINAGLAQRRRPIAVIAFGRVALAVGGRTRHVWGAGVRPRAVQRRYMVKAIWNGVTVAESADTVVVENNHYFPLDAVDPAVLRPSDTTTVCPWKGLAHYYTLEVGGAQNRDAAWFYPDPKPAAKEIKGRVAFWKGVKVG